jgi:hypothetical protein
MRITSHVGPNTVLSTVVVAAAARRDMGANNDKKKAFAIAISGYRPKFQCFFSGFFFVFRRILLLPLISTFFKRARPLAYTWRLETSGALVLERNQKNLALCCVA